MHDLADRLDDVIDLVYSSAKRLVIYNVTKNHPNFVVLGENIVEEAKSLNISMHYLADLHKKASEVKERSDKVHLLENKGDEIYESAITELFTEENAIKLVKNKEILSHHEKVTNAGDRIGKVLKIILVKYS